VSVVEFRNARLPGQIASPVRVMVVDDSAVARGFLRRWIEVEPGIEIVAALRTGREALDHFERADPDVVVLDIEMPDMDGITALPLLLAKKPGLAVIMASTLTRRNAEVTLKALSLGALDCVQKPDAQGAMSSDTYRHYLISKIRELGKRTKQGVRTPDRPAAPPLVRRRVNPFALTADTQPPPIALRPMPAIIPRVLAIGASTGGPQALTELCGRLGPVIDHAPVLVTQHMPPTFTTILAEHLARATGRPAREAIDGETIRAGNIYVAPGSCHLRILRANGEPVAALDDSPPVHFCKPAVDIMFSSAAEVWGGWVMGVVLTGMGSDGLNGANDIVAAGGSIIAQDEATSIVWGMPGSVAEAGLCSRVLPITEIAPTLSQLFLGRRP
jgi:two-component system chemotaxis response regulator CheB